MSFDREIDATATAARHDLAEQAETGLFVVQDDVIRYANPAFADMVGWTTHELVGQSNEMATAVEFREHTRKVVQRRLEGKPGRPGLMRCLRRDGSTFDARVFARRIEFNDRPAVLITLLDITELKDALRRAEWNASMLARTEALCRSGSFEVAWPSGLLTLSGGLRDLLGMGSDDRGAPNIDAPDWIPGDEQAFVAGIWRNAAPNEPFEFQHRV
jgi:PAS domain S-box-containing protein